MSAKTPGTNLARSAVYLAAAWLITWAGMKLFLGNPQSLPETVRNLSPFGPELTFRVAIALELSIFCLAMLKPHLGWLPLAGLYAFFLALLVPMVASGAESCGCGGGAFKMPPIVMLSVDAALLLGIVLTRPWKRLFGPGLSTLLLLFGVAASWAAPWLVIRSSSTADGPLVIDSKTGTVRSGAGEIRYAFLDPSKWKGRTIVDVTELTQWIAADLLPVEGSIVFWRQSCPHCAQHLREMAAKDDGSRQVLLVQARDDLKNGREVDAMPQGAHVTTFAFPENLECAFTTPCEVVIQGGAVSAILYEKDFHPEGG
ncbi:MAG: hypothetical protein NTY35_15460 [Planctomycetota bacterium]|nr:hypothetical protein [Planctomycetota bacterium]